LKSTWSQFLLRWLSTTLGVLVAAHLVGGVHYDRFGSLAVAALVLGLLNAFVRPLLFVISLPLIILTLGLGIFVIFIFINALFLWLAGVAVTGFDVDGFWPAIWGGVVVSLVSGVLNRIFGVHQQSPTDAANPRQPRNPAGSSRKGPPSGSGPVIDV